MGDIIKFPKEFKPTLTCEDIPVRSILREADKAELAETVVIGFNAEGELYFASSKASGPEVLWLLEKAKQMLLALQQIDLEKYNIID